MLELVIWAVAFVLGIFTLVVMWTVFMAAMEIREYLAERRTEWINRPIPR